MNNYLTILKIYCIINVEKEMSEMLKYTSKGEKEYE
jgi:hypothetical protein